jgi:hypothetical protein
MSVSKILRQELTSAKNNSYEMFTDRPPLEDYYLRDRLGGDFDQLRIVKKDLHVRSCLERRSQAATARERLFIPASAYEPDIQITTLARWCAENLPWDALERRLWEGAYINGRSHAEILWETRDTPRGLLEGEFDPVTGEAIRHPYPYPLITVPWAIRNRAPSTFTFRNITAGSTRRIKDATGLLDRSLKLPNQQVEGWELRHLTKAQPMDGEPCPVFKFISHSWGSETSNPNGKGVGGDLYWLVLLKKEFIAYWTIYADKYADPGKVGIFPETGSPNVLKDFFVNYGRDSWAALPKGYEVKLLEAQRAGTVNTYETFLKWIDGQISELITGQAYGVTASQGLSGQPAANDETIRQEWVKADCDLLCPTMREYLLTPLTMLNIPVAEPPSYWRDFSDREDLNQRSERDGRLHEQGYRLRPDAVRQIYGDYYIAVDERGQAAPQELPQPTPGQFPGVIDGDGSASPESAQAQQPPGDDFPEWMIDL